MENKVRYKEVKTINDFIDSIRIRVDVFIKEQGFPPGWEPDEEDKVSRHFVAILNNKIISTGRFREIKKGVIKIERMATKKEFRNRGIGTGLLNYMLVQIKKNKPQKIWVRSQVRSKGFYEKNRFRPISKEYNCYGVMHIDMVLNGI
jgi:predicted GNAT family N-acyltransferase